MNLPNRLTIGRLLISVVYFILMAFIETESGLLRYTLLDICLGIFIVAALTDLLDGYLARRYHLVTDFGRITDPFVDKILICGSFIFFTTWEISGDFIPAWMVVIILAREFMVSGLRSFAESRGVDFGSTIWGKHKMLVQNITISWSLFYLGHLENTLWAAVILHAMVWLTLITTILSGLTYLFKGWRILRARDI